MKNKVSIGISSIVLILLILCLSVFSLLSLSDSKTALTFADRRAESVKAYYAADSAGQELIRDLLLAHQEGKDIFDTAQNGTTVSDGGGGLAICEIPMSAGQSLHIELDMADSSVLAYYVYNSEDYAIDNRLPVWNGN